MRSETTQRFKPKTQTQLTVVGFPACALDYPCSKPSLPGSKVREASLSTADSSPQPASPSLWKVSFNHWRGGGDERREGGREDSRVGGRRGEGWLGTTVSHAGWAECLGFPSMSLTIVRDGSFDGREGRRRYRVRLKTGTEEDIKSTKSSNTNLKQKVTKFKLDNCSQRSLL